MYITYKTHNRCIKETFLRGSEVDVNIFSTIRSIPYGTIDINLKSCILNRHKLRQSQIATLSSQFVICRNLWPRPWSGILTPITLKRVMGTWESTHVHFRHEYEKFHICRFWCYFTGAFVLMYITCKAHNRCTKETFLIGSDVDVNIFSAFRSIPSGTIDINLKSCILNRRKLLQSQIATIQESLSSHFVICRILWSWPWRHKLSPITLKTCSGYLGEYPCSLLTWIWRISFLSVLALFHCYICLCVCISVIKPIIDLQRKRNW